MRKVRIAVAGAGMIGLRHIEETQKSQGAKLSAIVLVSGRDGLQNLRVTDAIAEAAKSGKTVNVQIN